jgi:1-acyl-sn-glycerol-3-phosphate acyltransferase
MDADGFGREMFSGFKRYGRVLGTGLGFLAVGIGGIFIFPVLNLTVREPKRRKAIARDLVQFTFRCIVRSMCALGVFHYETMRLQRLERRGQLILANHPTVIDIVFLMAFVQQADCIVKARLWRNPFTRATVRAAGYIANDDDSVRVIEDCIASIRDGGNLIIFPEGTRTPPDGGISLKRGAANIAVRTPCNVTPVHIRCTPPMLVKGEKWWRLPARPSHFRFEVMDDIEVQPFLAAAGGEALAARQLTGYLQKFFVGPNCHADDGR